VVTVGVQTWGTDAYGLRRCWEAADALGYARVTYGDGLAGFTHDGWTMLGALAAWSRRARIGPAVTYAFGPAAHHPSWLAKRAVTVDHLSGGRLDLRLAVGAGDAATAAAWRSHGIAYPGAGDRVTLLEETLEIIERLWSGEAVDHAGRHYTLRGARLEPLPLQKPGPPVWIAAMGARALGLAGRRAAGWEASYLTPAAFAGKSAVVRRAVELDGRSWGDFRRSVEVDVILGRDEAEARVAAGRFCAARGIGRDHPLLATALAGTPEAVLRRIGEYAAAGVTDLMLGFADFPETIMLEAFAGRVLPAL
jgi:alkanesulfonate monooxygenase SsuD/methylene tetrahydromethanopterin reductase-like flavin-dependent oxidoreductase (luciferase family)